MSTFVDVIKDWVELFQGVATSIAVIGGGVWAYYRFVRRRENIWNVDVTHTHSTSNLGDGRVLVQLNFYIKNIGEVPFSPGGKGYELAIRLVKLPQEGEVTWEDGTEVFGPTDMFSKYRNDNSSSQSEYYTLDVGGCYCERVSYVLKSDCFYIIKARLHGTQGLYLTDYYLVDARVGVECPREGN